MLDKLLNIGRLIWYNKERMVLLVVMVVLFYRIYVVFNPPEHAAEAPPALPHKEVPEELQSPSPSPRPPLKVPANFSGLYNKNPFWYYSGSGGANDKKEVKESDLGITLHAIRDVGGKLRAQLSTTSVPKRWYDQNEKFEQFELVEVNPEDNTVVVYSEQYARRFTLHMK